MPIELYPNIAKVKRNGAYQNLPGFVQQSGDADIKAMIANSEISTTAQYAHPKGSYFILNDILYKAILDIAVNGTIAVGTNCEVAILSDDVSEIEDDVDDLKTDVNDLNEDVIDLLGINNTLPITKITGLNCPVNGTAFASGANYETYYVPIVGGVDYAWTANKSSANPAVRLVYSESLPANGVACTYIEEQHIFAVPIKFTYHAQTDGYLSVCVWKNETNASLMAVKEEKSGSLDEIYEKLNVFSAELDNPIFVGTSARTIEVETSTIKAKKIIDYEGESSPSTWAGGLAIYKNLALIGYNSGYFGAFDLTTGNLIATGQCQRTSSHNNTLFFDPKFIVGDYPVVYASYCITGVTYCYVYSIAINNSTLEFNELQRISYSGQYFSSNMAVDWCFDSEHDELIAIIGENNNTLSLVRFKKPIIFDYEIQLTDADVISVVTNSDIGVRQSADISNGYMFMLEGSINGNLVVIDLKTGNTVNTIPLSLMSTTEPEGLSIENGKVYVNFHTGENKLSANLFEMKF